MRFSRTLALGASTLALAVVVGACSSGGGSSKPTVKVGSDGFDEAKVMAEVYAQVLEANGYTVNRDGIGLGGRKVTAARARERPDRPQARVHRVGARPTTTPRKPTGDPAANQRRSRRSSTARAAGSPCSTSRRRRTRTPSSSARRRPTSSSLTKMSDVAAVQDQLKLGLATDCPTNPVCGQALKDAYGIDTTTATLLDACSTPMADALKASTIDLGELCSTQPDILVNGFVLLQDDKQTQPADNIAPLVRNDFLAKTDKAAFRSCSTTCRPRSTPPPSPTCTSRSASTRRTSRTSSRRS